MDDRSRESVLDVLHAGRFMELTDGLHQAGQKTPAGLLRKELILRKTVQVVVERAHGEVLHEDKHLLALCFICRLMNRGKERRCDLCRERDVRLAKVTHLGSVLFKRSDDINIALLSLCPGPPPDADTLPPR